MDFTNYTNNAQNIQVVAAFTDITPTLLLKAGEGDLLPETNGTVTIEMLDNSLNVIKREVIHYATRVGDLLTGLSRSVEPCVQNDTEDPRQRTQLVLDFTPWSWQLVNCSLRYTEGNDKDLKETITWDFWVKTTTDQTVNGVKTFTASPQVPTPDSNNDAVNKQYVDEEIAEMGAVEKLSENISPAGEDIAIDDQVFNEWQSPITELTNTQGIGSATSNKFADLPFVANGTSLNWFYVKVDKVGSPTQNLWVRIETNIVPPTPTAVSTTYTFDWATIDSAVWDNVGMTQSNNISYNLTNANGYLSKYMRSKALYNLTEIVFDYSVANSWYASGDSGVGMYIDDNNWIFFWKYQHVYSGNYKFSIIAKVWWVMIEEKTVVWVATTKLKISFIAWVFTFFYWTWSAWTQVYGNRTYEDFTATTPMKVLITWWWTDSGNYTTTIDNLWITWTTAAYKNVRSGTLVDPLATFSIPYANITTSQWWVKIKPTTTLTLTDGQIYHIVMYQWTYGSEIVNASNYFRVYKWQKNCKTIRQGLTSDGSNFSKTKKQYAISTNAQGNESRVFTTGTANAGVYTDMWGRVNFPVNRKIYFVKYPTNATTSSATIRILDDTTNSVLAESSVAIGSDTALFDFTCVAWTIYKIVCNSTINFWSNHYNYTLVAWDITDWYISWTYNLWNYDPSWKLKEIWSTTETESFNKSYYTELLSLASAKNIDYLPNDFPRIAQSGWVIGDKIPVTFDWLHTRNNDLIENTVYYLSDVAWKISTTVGTNNRIIWKTTNKRTLLLWLYWYETTITALNFTKNSPARATDYSTVYKSIDKRLVTITLTSVVWYSGWATTFIQYSSDNINWTTITSINAPSDQTRAMTFTTIFIPWMYYRWWVSMWSNWTGYVSIIFNQIIQ